MSFLNSRRIYPVAYLTHLFGDFSGTVISVYPFQGHLSSKVASPFPVFPISVNGTSLSPIMLARTLESFLAFPFLLLHIQSITHLADYIYNQSVSQILSHFSIFTTLGKLPAFLI